MNATPVKLAPGQVLFAESFGPKRAHQDVTVLRVGHKYFFVKELSMRFNIANMRDDALLYKLHASKAAWKQQVALEAEWADFRNDAYGTRAPAGVQLADIQQARAILNMRKPAPVAKTKRAPAVRPAPTREDLVNVLNEVKTVCGNGAKLHVLMSVGAAVVGDVEDKDVPIAVRRARGKLIAHAKLQKGKALTLMGVKK